MAGDYSDLMECVFCGDITVAGELLATSRSVSVVLHPDWAVRGHLMVVAGRHVENLSDLSDDESAAFLSVLRAAERAALRATGCERAILLKLGIQTPHLHVHIYPVGAAWDRARVQSIIDAKERAERDEPFVAALRDEIERNVHR